MDLKLRGSFGYWLLRRLSKIPKESAAAEQTANNLPSGDAKIERFFGPQVWSWFSGKVVADLGCGTGVEAVAIASRGASQVCGIDVNDRFLAAARALAQEKGVGGRCTFLHAQKQRAEIEALGNKVDCVFSLDAFEHVPAPDRILAEIHALLRPGGRLFVSFGPPWKHPYGAHMNFFIPMPWVHFVFQEETILAVRALYRNDGAKKFEQVEGGLNRMTVARFYDLISSAGYQIETFRAVPIRGWSWLVRNRYLREYFTSVVQCVARKPVGPV